MDLLTLETILSNLPTVLSLWTALTLSWGLYIMFSFRHMIAFAKKQKCVCRPQDKSNVQFMMSVNALLALFLLGEPWLATSFGDAIFVINTFYSVYLVPASITVARWWFTKPAFAQRNSKRIPEDHLLT